MPDFKVTGSAEFSNLEKGLDKLQGSFKKTEAVAEKLERGLSKSVVKGSNQAAFALTNLGRVAQDAPFGFIGIQNNINPLLESFQRLQKESGSTGGALKALASSLAGGAGIGLAVSLVTSALTVLTQQGFFKATKAVNENSEAIKASKDAYDGIISSLSKEQAKIDQIVNALKTEVLTRKQRIEAINQLQKAAPQYFATLDKENATIGQITSAYDKFSQSILRSIEARVREKELIDVTEQILKIRDKATQLGQDEILIDGKLVKVNRQRVDTQSESLSLAEAYKATMDGTLALTTEEIKKLQELEKSRARLLQLVTSAKGAEQFNALEKGASRAKESISDVLAKLAREIDFLNKKEIAFNTNETKAKLSAYFSTIERLIRDFKVAPNDTLINKLFGQAGDIKIQNALNTIRTEVEKGLIAAPLEIPVKINPAPVGTSLAPQDFDPAALIPTDAQFEEARAKAFLKSQGVTKGIQDGLKVGVDGLRFPQLIKLAYDIEQKVKDFNAGVQNVITTTTVATFSSFGDAIEQALSGASAGDVFGAFFSTILKSLGEGIQQLGLQMLAANKLIQAAKAAFGKATGVVASIGLIALGSVIKALANKIKVPAFAGGVQNFSGGLALVGEKGPELVNLPRGSDVIPNHQLGGAIGGGQNINVFGRFELQNNTLVAAIRRGERTLSRQG